MKTNIDRWKWFYCFLKYSPLWSIHFCVRLRQFSQHFFYSDWNISKTCILNVSSSGVESRWPRSSFFTGGKKKKLLGAKWWMANHFDVLTGQILRDVWADVWELVLSWWRKILCRWMFFLISSKTSGKRIAAHHSELLILRLSRGTVVTCPFIPKPQVTICFEVLIVRTSVVGFGSSWMTHTVDFCLFSG